MAFGSFGEGFSQPKQAQKAEETPSAPLEGVIPEIESTLEVLTAREALLGTAPIPADTYIDTEPEEIARTPGEDEDFKEVISRFKDKP